MTDKTLDESCFGHYLDDECTMSMCDENCKDVESCRERTEEQREKKFVSAWKVAYGDDVIE